MRIPAFKNSGLWITALLLSLCAASQVITSQYDNFRTGATLNEKTLTPANVNPARFGKVGAFKVDGPVFAQPLFVPNLAIPNKGKKDVLFVATEHDSVYAFDASRPNDAPLWHVNFLDEKNGITTVSPRIVGCPFIRPEIGITSTPAIDIPSGTLFVLARTAKGNEYSQHLHALSIATGEEKTGSPKLIVASLPGKAADAVNGRVVFDAFHENPRTPLALVNGQVVLTCGSSCDVEPYHGWIVAYDAKTLNQTAVFNVTPDGREGGIWTSDAGIGVDEAGNLFVPTGNGTFSAGSGGSDYSDTVLKLGLTKTFQVLDYFTPHDEPQLNADDADVGSAGPLLLPNQPGPHPHVLLQGTKAGVLYVLDRDRMGKYRPDRDDVLQKIQMAGGEYGAPAYWNGHVFVVCSDDYLRDYRVSGGNLQLAAASKEPRFENPGATPAVSADGLRRLPRRRGTARTGRRSCTPSTRRMSRGRFTPPSKTAPVTARHFVRGS